MKKILSIVLVALIIFHGHPAKAEEAKKESKEAPADCPTFKLGTNPVNPLREVDFDKECFVVLSEPSPCVKLTYKKGEETGVSHYARIPGGGTKVAVDKKTHLALWVLKCGNEIAAPRNWEPKGQLFCEKEPAPTSPPAAAVSTPAPANEELVKRLQQLETRVTDAEALKKECCPENKPATSKVEEKKPPKKSNAGWWVGGGLGAALVGVLIYSLTKKSKTTTVPPPHN